MCVVQSLPTVKHYMMIAAAAGSGLLALAALMVPPDLYPHRSAVNSPLLCVRACVQLLIRTYRLRKAAREATPALSLQG